MSETITIRTSSERDIIKIVERGPQGASSGGGSGSVTSVALASSDLTITGSPITSSGTITANLANSGATAGTYTKVTVDAKGRVTAGATATASDVGAAPTAHTHVAADVTDLSLNKVPEARQTYNITSTNSGSPTQVDAQSAFQNASGSIDCVVVLNNTTGIVYADIVVPDLSNTAGSQRGRVIIEATTSGDGDITNFRINVEGTIVYGYDEIVPTERLVFVWTGDNWNLEPIHTATQPTRINLPSSTGTLALTESADSVFRIVGSSDATKRVAFEVDGLSTATTRLLTVPNSSGTLALTTSIVDNAAGLWDSANSVTGLTVNDYELSISNGTNVSSLTFQPGASRNYTMPSAAGTLALTSDITKTAVGLGNVTNAAQVTSVTGTSPIVSSGGTTPAISISAATTLAAGSMSAADKTKLDAISGTNTGDQTISLTGDVTGSGTGSFAATIANNAVTNAKLAQVATSTIKGRATAATGNVEDLTATQVRTLLNVADGATANSSDATLLARANHTGTQNVSTLTAGNWKLFYSNGSGAVTELALGSTSGHVLQTNGASSAPSFAALPSGGSKTYARWTALDNQPPSTAFATLDTRNSIAVLDFDAATDENAVFVGVMPEGASLGSGLTVYLHWMATSATSGNVRWGAQIERSNTDLDSDSFDTATEANGAANGTSGIATVTSITLTNIDSVTAGDLFRLKVYRNADDATNDTMSGDAELVVVEVRSAA